MTSILLSDIHLADPKASKTKRFQRFIEERASQFDRLYLLGDLFDAWPATTKYLTQKFSDVLACFKQLTDSGREVHYVEGNHDFHLGSYFKNELGVQVHNLNVVHQWDDKRVYLAHGDLGNPHDRTYRVLRRILRSQLVRVAAQTIPPKWVYEIGLKSSQMSRQYQAPKRSEEKDQRIRSTFRTTAEALFHQGYDLVFMGHTHLPDDHRLQLNGQPHRYMNTGDWVSNYTYIEYDGVQPELKRL